ncbi:MAG: hypothetical protein V4505_17660 [Pseudomonadota bacterium]
MPTPPVPRFIPTLTEVIAAPPAVPGAPPAVQTTPAAPVAPAEQAAPARSPEDVAELEERLVQRILQRVELDLSDRLTDALAAAVIEQTRSLLPRVRDEVVEAVRATVSEAVAQELRQLPADSRFG